MLCYISASPKGTLFPGEIMHFTDLNIKKSIRKAILVYLKMMEIYQVF